MYCKWRKWGDLIMINDRFGGEEIITDDENQIESRQVQEEALQAQEIPSNNTQEIEQTASKGFMFRYQCPACTGNAYYVDTIPDADFRHPQEVCFNCGHSLGDVLHDNFIALTPDEIEQYLAR